MKIELDIEDKYIDTNLYIMWGSELIARRLLENQYWERKVGFCSKCGQCCLADNVPFYDGDKCEYLVDDPGNGITCAFKSMRPFDCCVADSPLPKCTVTWEKVD